jgi:predicted nuclease with TOPRIM domain
MSDMSMDEMIEVLARYRYNAKHDADRIKSLEDELGRLRGDVDRLRDRYGESTQELSRLRAFTTRTIIPNEELQAQVERLTKAGDAMATILMDGGVIVSGYILADDWLKAKLLAAKKGGQP